MDATPAAPSRPRRSGRLAATFIFLVATLTEQAFAARTDVVTLKNGDRLTGEIRQLERGKLTYKTDDLGTVSIEWDKVTSLQSIHLFEVELQTGQKYFGNLV